MRLHYFGARYFADHCITNRFWNCAVSVVGSRAATVAAAIFYWRVVVDQRWNFRADLVCGCWY